MVVIGKRILVVDDEEIVRDSCKRALRDAGYSVRAVENGQRALEACRGESFDVMLTDLRMPDMDGLEVLRAVAEEFPQVRVIVITGYPSQESAEQGAKFGIFDYLEKPLSPGRLAAATAAALARPPKYVPPESSAPALLGQERHDTGETEPREVEETPAKGTGGGTARKALLISLGFLGGVTLAYFIAPVSALAYLAVGTALASGTILGLFSDEIFSDRAGR